MLLLRVIFLRQYCATLSLERQTEMRIIFMLLLPTVVVCGYPHMTIRCQQSETPCQFDHVTTGQTVRITCNGSPGSSLRILLGEKILPLVVTTRDSITATHAITARDNGQLVSCVQCIHQDNPHVTNVTHTIRVISKDLPPTTKRRFKRSETYEAPLRVSENKAYLQSGHTYGLPCTIIQPGDRVPIVFWQRGKSLDPARRELILRHAYPNDGQNSAVSPRYRISPSYGIIIDPVYPNDTDRYWCKTVKGSTGQFAESYLDVTVLDKTFPKESESVVSETSASMNIDTNKKIECPLLPQTPTQTDPTVYWSGLTADGQSLNILLAKFSDGEILKTEYSGTYSLVGSNSLSVSEFTRREERYCCHVFEEEDDLRTVCIDVTWLALATQHRPTIEGCDPAGGPCDMEISPHQDCLKLKCSIGEVYPKPALNWSYSDCAGETTFFEETFLNENSASQTYNVTSHAYIFDVEASIADSCTFTCTAYGEAITDQTISSNVVITRLKDTTTPSEMTTRAYPISSCGGCGAAVVLIIVFIVLIAVLILMWSRSREFVGKLIVHVPMFSCHKRRCVRESSARPSKRETQASVVVDLPGETSVMLTKDDEMNVCGEGKKEAACLVNREDHDVDITDKNFKWNYVGELAIASCVNDEKKSGFQSIKDVICIQDGGVVVIDEIGLHRFTSAYHYRFIDLKTFFGDEGYCCVAYFAPDKLLFGLKQGKIVMLCISNKQLGLSNFSSVCPVKHNEVELSGIAANEWGFAFASDRSGKAISVFDKEGVYTKRIETPSVEPGSLCAYIRNGVQIVFMISGATVRKHHISYGERERQSMVGYNLPFDIEKESFGVHEFSPRYITIQEDKLLVINHLHNSKTLQILQLNPNDGRFQHSIIADATDICSIRFISKDKVVVYTKDKLHLMERGAKKDL